MPRRKSLKSRVSLERDIKAVVDGPAKPKRVSRVSAELPAATLAQRLASLSTTTLMSAARELAKRKDPASDQACTAVLDEVERRVLPHVFEAFVAELFL